MGRIVWLCLSFFPSDSVYENNPPFLVNKKVFPKLFRLSTFFFLKHLLLVSLCHSWLAIWRDFVITQDVPWPSQARNNIWAKPVSPSVRCSYKHFNDSFLPLSMSNPFTWSPERRTWYRTHQSYLSAQSGSSTTIRLCQECVEFTLPLLDWSPPAWWVKHDKQRTIIGMSCFSNSFDLF